jgi:hypothetical protein
MIKSIKNRIQGGGIVPGRRDRGVHRPRVVEAAGRGWVARKAKRVGTDCQGSWNSPSRHRLSFGHRFVWWSRWKVEWERYEVRRDGPFKRGFYPERSD